MKILIKDCYLCDPLRDSGVTTGDVAVEGNRLLKVGGEGELPLGWKPERVIDGKDHLCLPGLINCHTHAAMTLLRSYADDLPLMHWLEKKIWPMEARLTGDDVYWGTLLAIVEMIESGTTTFSDMYFFTDRVAEAVEVSGVRACLSRGLIGIGDSAEQGLEESRELLEKWQGAADGRISIWLGPHAPYTCPPDFLDKVLTLAQDYRAGIHIHVAETKDEIEQIAREYGKTPVAYLSERGVFRFPVLAAHCVYLTEEDIETLAAAGAAVAHNPESNMKLASGIAPIPELLAAGVAVGIGTDGASSNNNLDMFEEMRTAALLHKVNKGDPQVLPASQVLSMATRDGARALRLDDLGLLQPGYKADLILVDLNQAHLHPRHNPVAHMVYSARGGDVETVIIDGRIVMEGRKILTIDKERVLAEVEERARRLLS
ncbi:MAG: 5-methylthioadenosine/S-adenosylhomocysteine deaminase [Thermacetogenium sp.]|uniref:5-methylthioadenosine/S-adenosylhomocysteine deaminase n=1 Tax=Thermacetogenium phaeum TaxID=85874 RepID=A0A101FF32_9THEO|nr:MAG: 5-methylthioadenosine/S-adenosylhomocysteine deaminase [Thermacetogenium phaeum]MDN5364886.1 5-methylthioadenosine/S-adenosylhomocysteine deaminase [Thermacetogenium sp.]MDN5375881.1 5-methylthioadenosine/S-adenosylhomocysteine deaminase [Thermacetogenium sp.]